MNKITCWLFLATAAFTQFTVVAKADYVFSTLASFDGTNGANPTAALISDSAGNLYGTTSSGGAYGKGAVYEIAAGTNALTTLYSFNGADGQMPYASLTTDAAGNLYGTTYGGGTNGSGTVFKIASDTHALTTLYSFNGTDGRNPRANLLADSSGNLYGTTEFGGADDVGTVYMLAASTNALTTLVSFTGPDFTGANGTNPWGGLIADAAGNLYGTTRYGGSPNGWGTVFKIAAGTHDLTTLVTFDFANGAYPLAGLVADAAGNLYGTTAGGGGYINPEGYGTSPGTVFKIAADTHDLVWSSHMPLNMQVPYAGVIVDAAGNLYGTTYLGDGGDPLHYADNAGTVFMIAANDPYHPQTALHVFSLSGPDGFNPWAGLFADADGNLYGTAYAGGVNGLGTVFKLTAIPVPEPSSMLLASLGALACAASCIHRRRQTLRPRVG